MAPSVMHHAYHYTVQVEHVINGMDFVLQGVNQAGMERTVQRHAVLSALLPGVMTKQGSVILGAM